MATKRILLICSGRYRGVDIYEMGGSFAIRLGMEIYEHTEIDMITKRIDEYFEAKKN